MSNLKFDVTSILILNLPWDLVLGLFPWVSWSDSKTLTTLFFPLSPCIFKHISYPSNSCVKTTSKSNIWTAYWFGTFMLNRWNERSYAIPPPPLASPIGGRCCELIYSNLYVTYSFYFELLHGKINKFLDLTMHYLLRPDHISYATCEALVSMGNSQALELSL